MPVSNEAAKQYQATIGIECHVQLKTKTKLFAAVKNDARDANPNTLISHICLGMPGALPYLNEAAVELASKAAFALGTKPQSFSKFDRKHYFYPDLPKGYQITQFDQPIIRDGYVDVVVSGEEKRIRVERAHLEEDAGKSSHPEGKDYSLVDLNRAGTPLLEIVSAPDMRSPAEAKAYVRELYLLMRYADVSDADLFHGNMRFDVNVSVSKTDELGTRTETKNLNSFKSVEKAAEYEIKRQIELIEKGQKIVQETRGWDDAKQKTTSQRGKEEAHDYRYMPEPDVPPVVLDDKYISKIQRTVPLMPDKWRKLLSELGLNKQQIETLLEAQDPEQGLDYLGFLNEVAGVKVMPNIFAHWFINIDLPLRLEAQDENDIRSLKDSRDVYHITFRLLNEGLIYSTQAKQLILYMLAHPDEDDVEQIAKDQNLLQISDEGEIDKIVATVLAENAKAADDVKNGEMKAIGFLVGQVMKESKGKANPELAQKLIKKQLGI